jgi:hypothetical protein
MQDIVIIHRRNVRRDARIVDLDSIFFPYRDFFLVELWTDGIRSLIAFVETPSLTIIDFLQLVSFTALFVYSSSKLEE